MNSYYPFGLTFNSYQRVTSKQNDYLYNGKELQRQLNLNHYAYGARFYDPAISRFTTLDPMAERYSSWSPYLYAANNPIRYEDTNGEGPGDKVLGFLAAVVDNATGGLTNVRSAAANYVSSDGAADFNMGQDMGDVTSMVVGTMMVEGGGGAATGGTLVTVGSGGLLGEVGIPVAVVGTAVAAEGTILGVSGAASLGSQKGRLNADGKPNPKREAREKAKVKRDQQPASEDYAKYKAKELEKTKGKDARREAHDKKESGTGDRSKKQIDEDYKTDSH